LAGIGDFGKKQSIIGWMKDQQIASNLYLSIREKLKNENHEDESTKHNFIRQKIPMGLTP
jgi:hypothetical protein